VRAEEEPAPSQVKELNFVFLHGLGGNPCTFQLLTDKIEEMLPLYAASYQERNPGITIEMNVLARCYPGYLNIETWAENVAESIEKHFGDRDNLIIVGHSMGGKVALYAVAHDLGGLYGKTAAVVTINSPVKNLDRYYVPGGGPMEDYCRTTMLGSDEGACTSLAYYDSSSDGLLISRTRHWIAFASSEDAPLSTKYDRSGVDVWPRNIDDGVVPLPAQFAEGADVIYYGDHGHSDFGEDDTAASKIANNLFRAIFGDPIECSVLAVRGTGT
jgi:pimeloyl-ACP methyl ester carboxylesterase